MKIAPDGHAPISKKRGCWSRQAAGQAIGQSGDEGIDGIIKIDAKIVLIDGEQLVQLMIEHGVGVTAVAAYILKRVDADYFEND